MTQDAPRGRLLYLTQIYDPEPAWKGADFARALISAGFEVEVVTAYPNYPGGRVYDGYRMRPLERGTVDGVAVTRLAFYPSHDRSAFRRMASYLSFMATSLTYIVARAKRPDVIYAGYPMLTVGLASVLGGWLRRAPVVLEIQDMWPDSLAASGMMGNRAALAAVGALCRFVYRRAHHIVVQSPGFRDLLVARGVPAGKISVIYNWTAEHPLPDSPDLPQGFAPDDGFRVLYAGNLGPSQGLEAVIEAAAIVGRSLPGCRFYFLGGGISRDALVAKAEALGLCNVRFLPRVSQQEALHYQLAADCLLLHLRDDPLYLTTIPSKLQAYLYVGRPVIAGVEGSAADLVREAGAGIIVHPEDPHDIARGVLALAALEPRTRAAMAAGAAGFYRDRLSFERGMQATLGVLDRVCRRRMA